MNLTRRDNSQVCQSILYNTELRTYYSVLRKLCRDEDAKLRLDSCARNMKRYVTITKDLSFSALKADAVVIEKLTVGQLLAAAFNCLTRKGVKMRSEELDKHMDMVADTILTGVLFVPVTCLRTDLYRSYIETDDNSPQDWSYIS